ncbi:MAG: deoxyribodipyrimidine photolyase [Pseudarcicella sp.]|nr:deoxyribodipyrimidine photolyase [Pseudarcicella sp.]MBP6409880.1 deoxyribodipyrimidine photolyase [Pseudarcicella sp.]
MSVKLDFATDWQSILAFVENIEPLKYAKTRNYIHGDVSYLSPYISRGFISTRYVLERVLAKGYGISEIESFVKELCWRDYFQRLAQHKNLDFEIKNPQIDVQNNAISTAIVLAQTSIEGIDLSIKNLYQTGYMHNHARMYTAALACNIARSHWKMPAKWMFYHLLDADWASNACSWQWVAATNSSKKYFANQENINRYTETFQSNTFLDFSYEKLPELPVPDILKNTEMLDLKTILPPKRHVTIDDSLPVFLYDFYNLDPNWHASESGNRVLILEPTFFEKYPVSTRTIDFIFKLSDNIPDMQVFVGNFDDFIQEYSIANLYFKEHPHLTHYKGIRESRDWIAPSINGYYPSFFAYWKVVEKYLHQNYKH